MARGIRSKRWSEKPPLGVGINWGHPISNGLVGCWVFSERAGTTIRSLIRPSDNLTLRGGASWVTSLGGSSLYTTTNSQKADLLSPSSYLQPPTNVTVIWRGVIVGNMAVSDNNPLLAAMTYDNANTTPFVAYDIARPSANQSGIFYAWSIKPNSFQSITVNSLITVGKIHTFGLSLTNGTSDCYADGKRVNGSSPSTGGPAYTSTSLFEVGGHPTATNQDSNCYTLMVCVWNRVVYSSEHRFIHSNPYDFLAPPAPRLRYFFVSDVTAAAGYGNTQLKIPSSSQVKILGSTKVSLLSEP